MENYNPIEEVGIKYRKIRIDIENFVLIPCQALLGYSMGENYYSKETYKTPCSKKIVQEEKYLIDEIISIEDLQSKYNMPDPEEIDFLIDYYFEEAKDNIILVSTKNDQIKKVIKISNIDGLTPKEVYEHQKDIPSVLLNETSFRELLEIEDIQELKDRLTQLRHFLEKYIEITKEREYVTRIETSNGKITAINTDAAVVAKPAHKPATEETVVIKDEPIPSDFSVLGLERYLKERIFGQDKSIRKIAKTMYMNYTAAEDETAESILIVGPSGTGKTATLRVASSYLNIPFKELNAPDLVPQGIVGPHLEDGLYSLIAQARGDIAIASKGILFIDEIDKLGLSKGEQKETVKQVLLKFDEGNECSVTFNKQLYTLNTAGITKIYAGAFTKIFERDISIGFSTQSRKLAKEVTSDEVKELIKNKEYFGIELLDRIKVPIVYHDLDYETKKRILLESKLSEYLLKKKRYERQFNVELIAEDSYIEAIFEAIAKKRDSIRIMNNMVYNTLDSAEYALCTNQNTRGKRLILTKDTVENPDNFTLL